MKKSLSMCAMAAIAIITLAGCGKERDPNAPPEMDEKALIAEAKMQIIATLKDPDSAQFRNVRWERKESLVILCGEVNAKNSFGGYVGFKPFHAVQPGLIEKARYDPNASLKVVMEGQAACGS